MDTEASDYLEVERRCIEAEAKNVELQKQVLELQAFRRSFDDNEFPVCIF